MKADGSKTQAAAVSNHQGKKRSNDQGYQAINTAPPTMDNSTGSNA
jgi:hypothetical protein